MNETLAAIHAMRSTHGSFTEGELPEAELEAILEAAVRAPNASARQSYSIVVVEDRATMCELCGYAGSRLLLFCADFTRLAATAGRLGHPMRAPEATEFVTASIDAALAAENAAIAATSLGVATLFTNGIHRGDIDRVYRLLGLPERGCFPLIALVLGYAERAPAGPKGRLRGPGVVHRGRYRKPEAAELDALVAEYDDPGRKLGLVEEWRAQGCEHYLDWFFTKWMGSFKGPSGVRAVLERAGFLD
jgi:nitroreductase